MNAVRDAFERRPMAPSFWQIALVLLLAVLLFGGRGRISSIMGDLAKGLTAFRKGLKDDEDDKVERAGLTDAADAKGETEASREKADA